MGMVFSGGTDDWRLGLCHGLVETKLGKSFALASFETLIDLPTRLVFRVLFDGNARGMSDFGTHTMGASSTRVVRSLQIDGSHSRITTLLYK